MATIKKTPKVLTISGDNHPFLGYRDKDTFQVVFIEAEFGDVYKH